MDYEFPVTENLKILILADSLALPRGKSWGNIPYETTYPYLLQKSLIEIPRLSQSVIIERGMRFRTVEKVLEDWDELVGLRQPQIVIIHVGIVDCAPRVLSQKQYSLISKLPKKIRDIILKGIHKYRSIIIRTFSQKVYVTELKFKKYIREIIDRANEDNVQSLVFINIITPPDDLEIRSPGYQKNVKKYNHILETSCNNDFVTLLDLDKIIIDNGKTENLTIDGMHINISGHQLLSEELVRIINNKVTKKL